MVNCVGWRKSWSEQVTTLRIDFSDECPMKSSPVEGVADFDPYSVLWTSTSSRGTVNLNVGTVR